MRFLRNRLARRFPRLGLLSDLALVGAAAGRLVRRGDSAGAARTASNAEMVLAAGAAVRLLNRLRRRRSAKRAGGQTVTIIED
ncbi:MAG: hypothetical protein AAFO29_12180 [Actinomycetota bacterium]